MSKNKIVSVTQTSINPLESLLNILPDDRPIRSLQVVESFGKCQQNFIPLHKTLDLDDDADLFKENILFGKKNTRYLCISKTEGHANFVVEKLKIINSNENLAIEGFLSIKNTADTNQKAWRKKQLVYKLTKTELASECITDIVILSKYKSPVPGFIYLGELEKVHICYKTAPAKPANEIIDFTQQIENLRIQSNMYPSVTSNEHYYESLKLSYQLPISPTNKAVALRQAPLPPTSPINTNTLSHYHHEFIDVPFKLNDKLLKNNVDSFVLPKCELLQRDSLDYDFNLEREVLCTSRSDKRKSTSNPFL